MGKFSTLLNKFAKSENFRERDSVCSDLQFRGLLMLKQIHSAESFFETEHLLSCEEYGLPCSSERARRFGVTAEAGYLHLPGRRVGQASSQRRQAELLIYYLAHYSTLKLEAICPSETSNSPNCTALNPHNSLQLDPVLGQSTNCPRTILALFLRARTHLPDE
jgi:hypothetical protein